MTGFNIKEEKHIHESILFGFAGNSDDSIVTNYCILHAKYYIYVKNVNKSMKKFNIDFLVYMCYLTYVLTIKKVFVPKETK